MADYDIEQLSDLVKSDILAESQGVGEIPVVTSLSGINSLPALRGNEVVEVPLQLLSKPAEDAAATAEAAAANATAATEKAVESTENADAATKRVTDSILELTEEKAKIAEMYASEQERISNENNRIAAEESRETTFGLLRTDMATAIGKCDKATDDAVAAASLANTAAGSASAEASDAKDAALKANTAASDADAAAKKVTDAIVEISTQKQAALDAAASANAAATNANSATNNANIAATAANQSATNLSAIKSECQDATSRCNSTNATAEEKIVAMDAVLKSISAESQAAPVKLEVSVPESISTKNKVVQRIGFQLYPTYVMQNVLFQRVSGESVMANPSGILSVNGTGTTKFYVIPPQNTEVWKEVDVTVRQPLIRLTSSGVMRLGSKIRIV